MDNLAALADIAVDNFWFFLGFPALLSLGAYFTVKSRAYQIRGIPKILRLFGKYMTEQHPEDAHGSHPLRMFFAAIGGCIGIGNVVGVCTAVKIGGPGAVFWVWMTALLGMLVKYAEVFLGMRFREKNDQGGYDGGPTHYLRAAFSNRWLPSLAALLLCIYGVEVYMFNTVVDTVSFNWGLNRTAVVVVFLAAVYSGIRGGLDTVGKVAERIVPTMIVAFLMVCGYVIILNISMLPSLLSTIVHSAFNGHAAVGGFAGSTALVAISQGVSWGCYTGDIGVGYASVIHSESSETNPHNQASLAILGIFLDTLVVCTLSLSIVLIGGTWAQDIPAVLLVQASLSEHLPYMHVFMPLLFTLLAYSTILAFFGVGIKSAQFLGGERGRKVYMAYGLVALVVFAYASPEVPALLMRLTGCFLLALNVTAFFRLRNKVRFDETPSPATVLAESEGR